MQILRERECVLKFVMVVTFEFCGDLTVISVLSSFGLTMVVNVFSGLISIITVSGLHDGMNQIARVTNDKNTAHKMIIVRRLFF